MHPHSALNAESVARKTGNCQGFRVGELAQAKSNNYPITKTRAFQEPRMARLTASEVRFRGKRYRINLNARSHDGAAVIWVACAP